MFVVDGIAYANEPVDDMSVVRVQSLGDYELLICFSTGENRLFDGTFLRDFEAFLPLFEDDTFDKPDIIDGILTWLHGQIDISTAKLYSMSYNYNSVA